MANSHIIHRSSRGKLLNRVKTGAIVVEGGVVVMVMDGGVAVAADVDSIVVEEGVVDMTCASSSKTDDTQSAGRVRRIWMLTNRGSPRNETKTERGRETRRIYTFYTGRKKSCMAGHLEMRPSYLGNLYVSVGIHEGLGHLHCKVCLMLEYVKG
jgi:hypothetical protein